MLGRWARMTSAVRCGATWPAVGCDVTAVREVAGPSGVALIFVAESGANSIVVAPGANYKLMPADVATDAVVRWLQRGAAAVGNNLRDRDGRGEYAKQRGARVILDPAPAPSDGLPDELLKAVDILTPNESEAALLAGLPPRPFTAERSGLRLLGLCKRKGLQR